MILSPSGIRYLHGLYESASSSIFTTTLTAVLKGSLELLTTSLHCARGVGGGGGGVGGFEPSVDAQPTVTAKHRTTNIYNLRVIITAPLHLCGVGSLESALLSL